MSEKSMIRIEFTDNSGSRHVFEREKVSENNVEFIASSLISFMKTLGWSEDLISDTLEEMDYKL